MKQNAGCLSIIFPFLNRFVEEEKELPYKLRDDFLSISESSFYKILKLVIKDKAVIFTKVGLKDLFFVTEHDRSFKTTYYNKIERKHVDFVLCEPNTLKPICAIELDDLSHERRDRVERDDFVNEVFKVAKLPLLRFKNKFSYTLGEVEEKLKGVLFNENTEVSENNIGEVINIPICPKCGVPMTLRTAKSGENAGKQFWGCVNYPKCREIIEAE